MPVDRCGVEASQTTPDAALRAASRRLLLHRLVPAPAGTLSNSLPELLLEVVLDVVVVPVVLPQLLGAGGGGERVGDGGGLF